ncbi:MAG: hypothetical protein JEZ03_08060 [Bacteroidales bacterium]|nr:hypothetical protein [Bacteroidales bacterium]
MTKEILIQTATDIFKYSENAVKEYESKQELLIIKINEALLNRPDIKELVGVNNLEMMKDNHANHVRFMLSLLKKYNAEVLVETVLWVFRSYQSHGFNSQYWSAQLNNWIQILKTELSEDSYQCIIPIYNWMQINIPVFTKLSQEDIGKFDLRH